VSFVRVAEGGSNGGEDALALNSYVHDLERIKAEREREALEARRRCTELEMGGWLNDQAFMPASRLDAAYQGCGCLAASDKGHKIGAGAAGVEWVTDGQPCVLLVVGRHAEAEGADPGAGG
jgi:hypothetical protein